MVRAMLAVCLSLIYLASCTLATPLFTENFETCTTNEHDIPGFEVDWSVIADMKCDSSQKLTGSWSAKVLPTGGQIGQMAKRFSNVPIDGRTITASFWLRFGNGNGPYPYQLTAGYVRIIDFSVIQIPTAPLQAFAITRDTSVAPINGWYKYTGSFVIHAPAAQPSLTQMHIGVWFNFQRSLLESLSTNVWMDNAMIDYAPSSVNGDPQFVGLRGQNYQVHGIDGAVYNLVSSASTQVNSRFVFLDHGKCPMFNGLPARNCWAHPGSYLGEVGVQQVVEGKTHQLEIVAGASDHGFGSVKLNGKSMSIGDEFADTQLFSVKYESSHSITVHTAEFTFTFDNSDMFINQAVSSNKPLSQLTAHGMLGQTHKHAVYASTVKYIAGEVDDYLVADNALFGSDFVYNQFKAAQ